MNFPQYRISFCFTVPTLTLLFVFHSSVLCAQFQRSPLVQNSGEYASKKQPVSQVSDAEQSIKNTAIAFKKAFDQGNAKAVASFWSPEGEYIESTGMRLVGRPAIEKAYAGYFQKNKNAKIKISVDSIRQIGNNLAIEEGRSIVTVPEAAPDMSQYTATHVKTNGKWSMVSVKESSISPAAVGGLKDLEWLIGNWATENQGVTLTTRYRWLPGNQFIERTFSSKTKNAMQPMGIQIIGSDPISGQIMSWTFNFDGSHAVGIWSAAENGWVIESRGVTNTGMITTAYNIISKIDDNGCLWQSVGRTANGVELPDALEVVSKRK